NRGDRAFRHLGADPDGASERAPRRFRDALPGGDVSVSQDRRQAEMRREVSRTERAMAASSTRISRSTTAKLGTATVLAVALCGCAEMTPTQRRAGTGTVVGAAGGAAIGAMAGNAGMGAAIGAGAGLLGGLVYDQHEKAKERAYQDGVNAGRRG